VPIVVPKGPEPATAVIDQRMAKSPHAVQALPAMIDRAVIDHVRAKVESPVIVPPDQVCAASALRIVKSGRDAKAVHKKRSAVRIGHAVRAKVAAQHV